MNQLLEKKEIGVEKKEFEQGTKKRQKEGRREGTGRKKATE